jgi:hypothetical protein
MNAVSIHISKQALEAPRFRATVGNRQSVGRTIGEVLDAVTADWDATLQEAEVRIEPLLNAAVTTEPHLIEVNGVWVIAGGSPVSPEDAERDFGAEMYAEREHSFYAPPVSLKGENENPS